MQKYILIGIVVAIGMLQPVQAGMNAEFRRHAEHPFQAGVLNMVIGAIAVLLVTLLVLRVAPPGPTAISAAPWWSLLGGVIGGAIVITMLISAPVLGAALLIACFVLGQLSSSVLIDHFGWVGYETRPLSLVRMLGIGLLLGGVLLIERGA